MKWFGRKAERGGARPQLVGAPRTSFALGTIGSAIAGGPAVGPPPSYEARVRDAYQANPVAQRAVRLVAEGLGSTTVYAAGEAGLGGDAAALVTPALLETVATQLLLHGNAYLQIGQDGHGRAAELWALRPERVTVEADAGGWPRAYLYRVGETHSRIAAVDPLGRPGLVHLRLTHPLDDHYGLGCLGAAGAAVALHNEATRWNRALLANAARPSGALTMETPGGTLTAEQFDRLRAEMEASFSGSGNAGRPLLLEGGLRWQAMSLTPADMDFVGLKAAAAREIALAFGVPAMLLGLPGDTAYANYREANKALWRLTILPLAGRVLDGMSRGLAAWWPGLKLEVDLDRVSALADERAQLWASVSAAEFLSVEEKREMVGFARTDEVRPPSPSRRGAAGPSLPLQGEG